jgi:hypothetical protein
VDDDADLIGHRPDVTPGGGEHAPSEPGRNFGGEVAAVEAGELERAGGEDDLVRPGLA